MKNFTIYLLLLLLVACTPKTGTVTGDNDTFLTAPTSIDVTESQKVGVLKGEKYNTTMNKGNLLALLEDRFRNVEEIKNVRIIHQSGEYYYLAAEGIKDNQAIVLASELTLNESQELYLDAYNKLNHLCFGQYCGECAFRFKENGSIDNCTCSLDEKKNRPGQMAACGYSMSIATMEKKF